MKTLKFLSYLLLPFALSCEAQAIGKIASKIGAGLFGGAVASAVAKNKSATTLETEISKFVGEINKAYSFPVKISEVSYLAAVAYKDKEILFAYLFMFNFNSLSPSEKREMQKSADDNIYNYHRAQCQNKIIYDNLLSKGALFRYELYSADEILIQAKTLTASDCHK